MERGIALLSGGIDSPVAIYLLQDRLDIIAIHFHQLPLTDEKEIDKVKELCRILGIKKLYLVPFTNVLKGLVEKCHHRNYYILSKILMCKVAEGVAQQEFAQYLITGENLGQVSSQTLSNLTIITQNVSMAIFRPVLTYDKQEIVDLAQKIGTYDISKGPEICCLLGPKHPATKAHPEEIARDLADAEVLKLVEESRQQAEVVDF